MPIGLVSDEDLARELESLSPPKRDRPSVPEVQVEILDRPGRSDGDVNVPDSLRQIIGETALIEGRQSALKLASQFGISPSSVSAYTNGATSTASYDSPKPSIINHLNKSRARALKKASKTLHGALEAITQEKLDYTDAKDLSVIAKNMSGIIKDLEPPTSPDSVQSNSAPQFVIFAPQFRDERSFETIEVKE